MKIKSAIFDMDGTLVDSLMFWDIFWQDIGRNYLKQENFKPDEEVDKKIRTMIFSDAMSYIKKYYEIPLDEEKFLAESEKNIENFYITTVKGKEGARELLDYLKSKKIKMCVASATDMKYIEIALESCGLRDYFDTVLSCADIGVGKDQPDIYLKAMKKLGDSAEEICVFEDSYVALETAKKIGFQTVGIYDKYNYEQDRLKKASSIYLHQGQTLRELVEKIH